MTLRAPSQRIILAILALVAVALLAAGCGGSSSDSSSESAAASTTSTTGSGASTASFRDCLKQNGIDTVDPSQAGAAGGPPQGLDPAKLQQAMQACGSLAPQGGFGGAAPGGQSNAGSMKFQQCLEDNGVSGFGQGAPGSGTQADREKFQKAMQACGDLAPQGGFPRGGAAGAGGGNFQAFSRCMKRNGAELPGPVSTTPVDTTSPKYLKAQKKCRPLLGGTGASQ